MEEYLNRFLSKLAADNKYSANTIAAYGNDLTQLGEHFQNREGGPVTHPAQVTPIMIQDYVHNLQRQGYASSTVARKIAAAKSFFHQIVAEGIVEKDPTANLVTPKFKKRRPRVLSYEEIERLLTAPGSSNRPKAARDRALLEILYATGMRVTEVVSLQLEDMDLDAGRVRCRGEGRKERIVPIQRERALKELRDYVERVRPALARDIEEEAVFLNHRGQPLTRQGLWLIIKSYADMVELSDEVTPHTLRHSFAHHALHHGEDVRRIQHLLGHANLSTTQVYTQLEESPPEE